MEILDQAIKRTVEEVVYRGGVVRVSEEAKRLAAAYPACGVSEREIADALTAEAMRRSNVALQLGGTGRSGVEERVGGGPELGQAGLAAKLLGDSGARPATYLKRFARESAPLASSATSTPTATNT